MKNVFYISPEPLTLEQLGELLAYPSIRLELSAEAEARIQKCRDYLDRKMEQEEKPIYGITKGFGSHCNRSISREELTTLQENLVKSHACSTGDELNPDIIRLMLILKAHALSLGNSGVQIATVHRILDLYNNGVLPVVYDRGSLGASGDLAPLANLFLPLIGLGEVRFGGERKPAAEVCRHFGWESIKLQSKEGLALLNGTQFMSAHGVYALLRIRRLSQWSDIIATLSLEGFDGRKEPFHPNIQTVRPHAGQAETAAAIRKYLEGSELIAREKKHVQDPYSFRCVPQVHGACKDAIHYAEQVVLTEINSVTDNPTIWPDEDLIISGGNFHGEPLALTYDFVAMAVSELSNISERRTAQLIFGLRDLPEFLVAKPGLNSGFMIPQYAAAAMVSQNKQLCTPSSVDSIVSSNGQEDLVSMGANGATKLLRVVDNTERVLAIELMNAAQAIEFRRPAKSSPILEKILAAFRAVVPAVEVDKVMYTEIEHSVAFLRNTNPADFV